MIKKLFTAIVLICFIQAAYSQSLTNWKHFYAPAYGNYNMGNSIAGAGPEEIVELDKSTLAYTRIPFPADIRQVNAHSGLGLPYALQGPGASVLLRGTTGNNYSFDGTAFSTFSGYLGYSIDSASFLPFIGGSVFFTSTDNKLNKYDGTTHTVYDLSNSPYTSTMYYYINPAPNDDIFMAGPYNIAVYHGGVWSTYDTAFFHQHGYMNTQALSTSPNNDYTFFNGSDSTINTFVSSSNSWTSVPVPPSLIHGAPGLYISSSLYDASGNLWLAGDRLFCEYDGTAFHDYYSTAAVAGSNLTFSLLSGLGGSRILFSDGYHNYIFDSGTMSSYRFDDPYATLSGNQLLPSLKDVNGDLWFGCSGMGTENALMKFDGTDWNIPVISNIFYGGIFTIKQDTGQTIVFGGGDWSSDGPMQFKDSAKVLDPAYTYNYTVEELAIDQSHHYWYGGTGSGPVMGLAEYDGSAIAYHFNPVSSNMVYALGIDSLDNKWVGYTSDDGVYKLSGSTWTNYNTSTSPLPCDTVDDIIRQPNTNIMWFCTENGFAKLDNGTWTIYNTSNTPLPGNKAEYVYFADDGSTWFGTQNGFASLHGTTWEVYTTANSQLHNSDVESIVLDNDCNVWISTESGLDMVENQCAASAKMHVSGNVYHPGNVPAVNTLVYVYKLNASRTDVDQVDNVYTDNTGKYYYTANDTGSYFFEASVNQGLFPGEITAYHDSALVIQYTTPVHITASGNFTNNIWLKKTVSVSGSCSFNGKLVSSTERTGSVRLVLMYGSQPVTSVLSNMDGTFTFSNIAPLNYTIWVDKYGLNNAWPPVALVNCANSGTVYPYNLYPDHLTSVNDIAGETADHFNIFPNPFNERFTITVNEASQKNAKLSVTDINGRIIFEKDVKLQSGENQVDMDGSSYSGGIYFVQLRTNDKVFNGKIVK